MGAHDIEAVVRQRLRALRTAAGLSLDGLGRRAGLSPSTISRIETGKRAISLDVLVPLARSLQVDLESLLGDDPGDEVVIRPTPTRASGRTTWVLSRPTSPTIAVKMRIEDVAEPAEQQVHPGHDWFFVLEGRVVLRLGAREVIVEAGQAAEFPTMTPHAIAALDGPAEIISLFDRDGLRAHAHAAAPDE